MSSNPSPSNSSKQDGIQSSSTPKTNPSSKDGSVSLGSTQRSRHRSSPTEVEGAKPNSREKNRLLYEAKNIRDKSFEGTSDTPDHENSTGEGTTSSEEEGEIDERRFPKSFSEQSNDESDLGPSRSVKPGGSKGKTEKFSSEKASTLNERSANHEYDNDHTDDAHDDDNDNNRGYKNDDEEMEDTENEENNKILKNKKSEVLSSSKKEVTIGGKETEENENNKGPESAIVDDATSLQVAAAKDLLSVGVAQVVTATAPVVRESFLSDSLTEEERRTRTRYIPAVEGMHALRKQEVKRDLLLARTLAGSTAQLPPSKARLLRDAPPLDESAMEDVDNDDTSAVVGSDRGVALYDEKFDGTSKVGTRKIQAVPSVEYIIPSTAFRPPPLPSPPKEVTDSDENKNDQRGVKRSAPVEVESITAFNPPRLPESVSVKKKHRMLRWQRRPADMDADLLIYQQTVQKQRDELNHAEAEFQRIQTIDNHLRRHFLQHIKCINEEMALTNKELAVEQLKCLKATEWYLPTSRARGRNDGKTGSKSMKDIIHGLRRLDVELVNKRDLMKIGNDDKIETPAGVGGVSGESFLEWQRSSKIKSCKVASAWVIPNDKVLLPSFGNIEGLAVKFFPYSALDVTEPPPEELFPLKPRQMYGLAPFKAMATRMQTQNPSTLYGGAAIRKKKVKGSTIDDEKSAFKRLLSPRFAVKLPFGVGFFAVNSVVSNEDPSTYTNTQLADRWNGLIETATVIAPTLDIGAMMNKTPQEVNEAIHEYERSLNLDDSREPARTEEYPSNTSRRVVPFGSTLLPTLGGRGALLEKSTMAELNHSSNKLFYGGKGVMGKPENLGVTPEIRELENQNQNYLKLQARVLHLRNKLYRQRRIRTLNEKTYNATKERAARVETLVAEMRTDLKTLKERLDDEIHELGLSEETVERILSSYYKN